MKHSALRFQLSWRPPGFRVPTEPLLKVPRQSLFAVGLAGAPVGGGMVNPASFSRLCRSLTELGFILQAVRLRFSRKSSYTERMTTTLMRATFSPAQGFQSLSDKLQRCSSTTLELLKSRCPQSMRP